MVSIIRRTWTSSPKSFKTINIYFYKRQRNFFEKLLSIYYTVILGCSPSKEYLSAAVNIICFFYEFNWLNFHFPILLKKKKKMVANYFKSKKKIFIQVFSFLSALYKVLEDTLPFKSLLSLNTNTIDTLAPTKWWYMIYIQDKNTVYLHVKGI